jgi:hypothetical protein
VLHAENIRGDETSFISDNFRFTNDTFTLYYCCERRPVRVREYAFVCTLSASPLGIRQPTIASTADILAAVSTSEMISDVECTCGARNGNIVKHIYACIHIPPNAVLELGSDGSDGGSAGALYRRRVDMRREVLDADLHRDAEKSPPAADPALAGTRGPLSPVGSVFHRGTVNGGHYTAKIASVDPSNHLRRSGGGTTTTTRTTTTYNNGPVPRRGRHLTPKTTSSPCYRASTCSISANLLSSP